ncbi:uncharacterized protein LOC128359976 [Scomber japonicus]|uniref:uncharacterized protein LOC128359976 n=1 Tax=Scomber japonicus TaxID=13676 RepID=UPI002305F055|nr:uncharacterized protein LOC128359976 [Scomber japonicus]
MVDKKALQRVVKSAQRITNCSLPSLEDIYTSRFSLEEKVAFMAVNGTKTLLLSAYMEHRKQRQVRVISVVLRSEDQNYHCSMCCNEKLYFSKGVGDIHSDHFDFSYGTADIMCPLPEGCETPSHIAVTDNAPRSDLHKPVYLEVKNQNHKSDALPYNFTVCISTMFNFTNVLQLVQSLEMMQLLGVDRVAIYKSDCSPETQRVLDYYTKKGLVEVIPWTISNHLKPSRGWLPMHGPGDIHYLGQIPALTDCVYRYMYQSRYVSLQDTDELILPQSVNSWSDLLPQLEKKYGVDKCYMFENNVFPNNVTLPLPASQKQQIESPGWKNVPGVNILAHLHHEPIIKETHYSNFKLIVNPRAVFRPTVHGLLKSEKGCAWVDRNIARMYHTRAAKQKLKPDQLIYDGRLLKYSDRLLSAVNTVLKETGSEV